MRSEDHIIIHQLVDSDNMKTMSLSHNDLFK